ncbi:MAG: hypothetical protein BWY84_00155 [Candidatus Aerophobetes bacterium ADurb.Bin490]|nr:MAG: hypothetical protein BWY84_00155 [Candidatus Aerophobetes bacterium ADurb.Bin490]
MVPVASWVKVWSIFIPISSPVLREPDTRCAENIFSVIVPFIIISS